MTLSALDPKWCPAGGYRGFVGFDRAPVAPSPGVPPTS